MSQTLAATELGVRLITGDLNSGGYQDSSERLRDGILGVAQDWAIRLGVPETWLLAAITLTGAGVRDVTASAEYVWGENVGDAATGRLVTWVSSEEMARLRQGLSETVPVGP